MNKLRTVIPNPFSSAFSSTQKLFNAGNSLFVRFASTGSKTRRLSAKKVLRELRGLIRENIKLGKLYDKELKAAKILDERGDTSLARGAREAAVFLENQIKSNRDRIQTIAEDCTASRK